jgi:hypothetical protein
MGVGEATSSIMDGFWRRSSRCEADNCLEVSTGPLGHILVRSSKAPSAVLDLELAVWQAFTIDVREGRFDHD